MTISVLWFGVALVLTNALAFFAQGIDKRRAERRQWRVPERTLLLLGLPLAALGMIAGMRAFRHKTKKASFLVQAGVVAGLNVAIAAGLAWLWWRGYLILA